jgi:hypothetical protein
MSKKKPRIGKYVYIVAFDDDLFTNNMTVPMRTLRGARAHVTFLKSSFHKEDKISNIRLYRAELTRLEE